MRARAVRVEFALGSLVRGEWRISDARLEGPEFATGLDGSGRLVWPVPKIGFDPEGVAIERLTIEDGRAILSDAASGARLVLDKLEFKGELRSLAGPIKGEGSVVVAGQHYPYRVAANRIAEDTVRVRLAVDPIDRPLTAEADVSISLDRDKPRFEGSLQFARPVGRAPAGGQALIIEPWRATSRIKGDGTAAALEQIEFQYGPDDRATKLRGSANLTFGRQPEIVGALSSPQLDLDRVLALPEATRRRPLAAIRTLAESLTGALRLPIPATVSLSVDTVTLGGATLQRVGAELQADGERLNIKGLDFRAPGVTQVHLKGRLGTTSAGVQLEGSTKVEANDPRALLAWLTDRTDPQAVAAGPLRLAGEVTLGNDAIAIDGLKLELDRMSVAGRFGYAWANDSRPARLDAALTTPEIDLDRVHAFAKALLGDTTVDWPRQGALSLKIARAAVAGVEAKQADVNMRIDADGIEIEQFSIADFGGAALAVKGRIDTQLAIAARRAGARPRCPRARRGDRTGRQIRATGRGAAAPLGRPREPAGAARLAGVRSRPGWKRRHQREAQDRRPRRRVPCRAARRRERGQRCVQGRQHRRRARRGQGEPHCAPGSRRWRCTGRFWWGSTASLRSTSGPAGWCCRRSDRSMASLRSKASSLPARSTSRPTARSALRVVPARMRDQAPGWISGSPMPASARRGRERLAAPPIRSRHR